MLTGQNPIAWYMVLHTAVLTAPSQWSGNRYTSRTVGAHVLTIATRLQTIPNLSLKEVKYLLFVR
jgi:hypothetical protein